MRLYFDTAYVGECYWNEPDGALVRKLARRAEGLYSSAICIAEMACLAHRNTGICFWKILLITAEDAGFSEIRTNDGHMLAAAPHFGLAGRSV